MGDLIIRGMTRAVRLDLHVGRETDSAGQPRLVLTTATVLNRRDYGLNWNGLPFQVAEILDGMAEMTVGVGEAS